MSKELIGSHSVHETLVRQTQIDAARIEQLESDLAKAKDRIEWRDLPTMADVAAAQAAGDEIEYFLGGRWEAWRGVSWSVYRQFRARPRPKMEKVKMLCWFINGHLNWLQEGNHAAGPDWKRVPSEDKEIEIEVEDD